MTRAKRELQHVVAAVRRFVPLERIDLPEEFYPAHLPTALIDAVFRPHLGEGSAALVERYCCRFGVPRTRPDRWSSPLSTEQEPLRNLMRRCESLGLEAMAREVFMLQGGMGATGGERTGALLGAARTLRGLGIEVLEDVAGHESDVIEHALRSDAGLCELSMRRFLMYTGGDEFVRADLPVRVFVARALGRATISASRAESLVRRAAHELILAPRFLDWGIWEHGGGTGAPAKSPPEG